MALMFSKIDWRQKPSTREVVGFGGLFFVILIAFIQGLVTPQSRALKKVKGDLSILYQQEEGIRMLLSNIDRQLKEHEAGRTEQKQGADNRVQRILSYKAMDRNAEIATAVALLSSRRFLKGLKFKAADVGTAVERKGYTMIPLEIQLQGPFASLSRYLEQLETIDRPLLIGALNLNTEAGGSFLVAKLGVELYLPK